MDVFLSQIDVCLFLSLPLTLSLKSINNPQVKI